MRPIYLLVPDVKDLESLNKRLDENAPLFIQQKYKQTIEKRKKFEKRSSNQDEKVIKSFLTKHCIDNGDFRAATTLDLYHRDILDLLQNTTDTGKTTPHKYIVYIGTTCTNH